ncbi:MAG: tetratricopeptide repeat protein [Flavobacteriaceae bacterium]|jgi:tetratricopeptide (TPR) repeat protein|nr:tetratricopeptide repeat protein [Formosa sp.]MDG1374154.1 tetratricopeptide repeat protein [Flavobacteriaceae bacterium]MDG2498607.1 tetratricopeptide repeat protein [Flavobacteriaceae bacterium]
MMNRTRHGFVAFCILISSFGVQAQVETDSLLTALNDSTHVKFQTHFYDAMKHKALGNYSKAIDELLMCEKLNSIESVVFHELGINYFKLKQFERAEFNLQKAIELNADNFWYKESLYHLYIEQNRFEEATLALQPMLTRHPDYKQDLVNLYFEVGRYQEALNVLDELDYNFGINAARDSIRKDIYDRSGLEAQRIAHLKTRLQETPEDPSNFLNLIYAYSELNKKKEAFETAQEFLKQHPKSHFVHVALYKFYLDAKEYDKAIASMKIVATSTVVLPSFKVKVLNDFMSFIEKHPEYKSVLLEVTNSVTENSASRSDLEWADYYYNQKNYLKAISSYIKALEFDPNNFTIIKNLALLYLETNQFETAVLFTNDQLEMYPSQPLLYLVNGMANKALNNLDMAVESLSMGLDYIYDNNEIQYDFYKQLSATYELQGNIEASEAFTKKAMALKNNP